MIRWGFDVVKSGMEYTGSFKTWPIILFVGFIWSFRWSLYENISSGTAIRPQSECDFVIGGTRFWWWFVKESWFWFASRDKVSNKSDSLPTTFLLLFFYFVSNGKYLKIMLSISTVHAKCVKEEKDNKDYLVFIWIEEKRMGNIRSIKVFSWHL